MTQEQELEKLRDNLAEAMRKARQYENRVKVLTNNQRDRERRARTRRPIEHGAILESVLPVKDMNGPEIKALLTKISAERRWSGDGGSGTSALLYRGPPPPVFALCEAQP